MAGFCRVIDEFAKDYLHDELRWIREALVWKLDGLSEYDIRRPLTATGTNLLGLVKHSATWEARYFGEVFGRPFPEPLPRWDDEAASGTDLWVTEDETREQIVGFYRRAWEHADATMDTLPIDAPGHVPWWPRPDVKLFNILVHILAETTGTLDMPTSCENSSTARSGPAAEHGLAGSTRLPGRTTARKSSRPPEQLIPPAPDRNRSGPHSRCALRRCSTPGGRLSNNGPGHSDFEASPDISAARVTKAWWMSSRISQRMRRRRNQCGNANAPAATGRAPRGRSRVRCLAGR